MDDNLYLIEDDTEFEPMGALPCPELSLLDCIENNLLTSPDTGKPLSLDSQQNILFNEAENFPLINGCPQLYPLKILEKLINGELPLKYGYGALEQYLVLSQVKQRGDVNAPTDSTSAKRTHWRFSKACEYLSGITLDIGCDRPSYSRLLLPKSCQYLGLDPYLGIGEFRLLALGEIIPVRSGVVDNVLFNTSLDHILDYMTAIEEASRVLKTNGTILINTYAWKENATLLRDTVHFHHFREFQILGALDKKFNLLDVHRYQCPKKDSHRYTLIVKAQKR